MKQQKIPDNAVVIVLGAQVFRTHLSGTLYNRVEAAADYLRRYPRAKCITTGGQGANEPRTEGDAAKEVLVQMGIDADRVFAETRSATTWENLRYAREILLREGFGREGYLSSFRTSVMESFRTSVSICVST